MLHIVLEKTAQFHGFKKFSDCLGDAKTEDEVQENTRLINLMSHGQYSLLTPGKWYRITKNTSKTP